VELGILTPPEEFIKAALDNKADAILMSSLYGMGENDVQGFKENCIKAGLNDVILHRRKSRVKLTSDDEVKFKKLGFDRVYPPASDVKAAIADLWTDLKAKGKA
jgi:methylaspartate mutase S subunit